MFVVLYNIVCISQILDNAQCALHDIVSTWVHPMPLYYHHILTDWQFTTQLIYWLNNDVQTSQIYLLGISVATYVSRGARVAQSVWLRMDDQVIKVRSLAQARDFSSNLCVQGPTQPPVQWVPWVLSPGVKHGQGVTLTIHHYLVLRSWMSRSYTSSPPAPPYMCCGTALPFYTHTKLPLGV
jgi:hypothetical protein